MSAEIFLTEGTPPPFLYLAPLYNMVLNQSLYMMHTMNTNPNLPLPFLVKILFSAHNKQYYVVFSLKCI